MFLDQSPSELATAAVKLPGITITHFLKDSGDRELFGSQANLTEEQTRYIGALKKGEAIVHSGFAEQAVNIQVPYFRSKFGGSDIHWSDERIAYWMEEFYASRPYMKDQLFPVMDSWEPDPKVLENLEFVTKSEEFQERLEEYLSPRTGLAKVMVERMLLRHRVSASPMETQRYVSLFLNFVSNLERCENERG